MNYYTYVNTATKQIEDLIQKLPENWRNVNGLNLFSDEKLSDMSWAGYENCAWVPFKTFNFVGYKYESDWFEVSKNNIKADIRRQRKEKLLEVLSWNNKDFIPNTETKVGLSFIISSNSQDTDVHSWDFLNGTEEITKLDASKIVDFIVTYSNNVYTAEKSIKNEIDNATTIEELKTINFDPEWPLKVYYSN